MSASVHEEMRAEALAKAALKVGDPVLCFGHPGEIVDVFVRDVDGRPELYYRRRWTQDGQVLEEDCIGWACPGGIRRRRAAKPRAEPKKRRTREPRGLKPQRSSAPKRKQSSGVPCRSCGAPIGWCVTEAGKRIPLDAEPVPDGNMVVLAQFGNAPGLALPFDPAKHEGWTRWRSHFATCPNADKHRRPRARQGELL